MNLRRRIGAALFVFFATLALMNCGDTPTTSTKATSESGIDCDQIDVSIRAQRESTSREVNFFDSGENVITTAIPLGWGGQLSGDCRYSRTASWAIIPKTRSVVCEPFGEIAGLSKGFSCETFAGEQTVTVCVKHGGFGNCRDFRVIP